MHWDFKLFSDLTWDNPGLFRRGDANCDQHPTMDNCLIKEEASKYVRTYAKAVAGSVTSFSFNITTLVAKLQYTVNTDATLPTLIFASQSWTYPHGYDVTISPPEAATWSLVDKDHINVIHSSNANNHTVVYVTISPQTQSFLQSQ
jgi:hypothetical protein